MVCDRSPTYVYIFVLGWCRHNCTSYLKALTEMLATIVSQSVWTSKLINSASHSHKNKKIWSISSSSYADIARHFDQSISFCKRENNLILKFSHIYRLIQLLFNNPFFFFFFPFLVSTKPSIEELEYSSTPLSPIFYLQHYLISWLYTVH